MAYDGLTDAYDRESMGASTERHNDRFEITREAQDAVAARSHQRAAAAQADGVFDAEIVPVEIPQRKGDPVVVTKDEGIRPETTVETLAEPAARLRRGRLDHGGQLVADLGRRLRRRPHDPLARR